MTCHHLVHLTIILPILLTGPAHGQFADDRVFSGLFNNDGTAKILEFDSTGAVVNVYDLAGDPNLPPDIGKNGVPVRPLEITPRGTLLCTTGYVAGGVWFEMDSDGNVLATYDGAPIGGSKGPGDATVGPDCLVYAVHYSPGAAEAFVFDNTTHDKIGSWVLGDNTSPAFVDQSLFVSGWSNHQLREFDTSGNHLGDHGSYGSVREMIASSTGLLILAAQQSPYNGPDGWVWYDPNTGLSGFFHPVDFADFIGGDLDVQDQLLTAEAIPSTNAALVSIIDLPSFTTTGTFTIDWSQYVGSLHGLVLSGSFSRHPVPGNGGIRLRFGAINWNAPKQSISVGWGGLDPTYECHVPWQDASGGWRLLDAAAQTAFLDNVLPKMNILRLNPTYWTYQDQGNFQMFLPSASELSALKAIAELGTRFHLVFHSPPPKYKLNACLVGCSPTDPDNKLDLTQKDDFATSVVIFLNWIRSNLQVAGNPEPIASFSLQNEPDYSPPCPNVPCPPNFVCPDTSTDDTVTIVCWPSCRYDPGEYLAAFKAVAQKVENEPSLGAIDLVIGSGSSTDKTQDYVNVVKSDSVAWDLVDSVATHIYGQVDPYTGQVKGTLKTYGKPWFVEEWNWHTEWQIHGLVGGCSGMCVGVPPVPSESRRLALSARVLQEVLGKGCSGFLHWATLTGNFQGVSCNTLAEGFFTTLPETSQPCYVNGQATQYVEYSKVWMGFRAVYENLPIDAVRYQVAWLNGNPKNAPLHVTAFETAAGDKIFVASNTSRTESQLFTIANPLVSSWTLAKAYIPGQSEPVDIPFPGTNKLLVVVPPLQVLVFRGQ